MALSKGASRREMRVIYTNQRIITPVYIVDLARNLRNNMTDSEKKLWSKLRMKQINGYKSRCQHPIYRYILDFYCHEKRLAIEIDGKIHNSQKEYDRYRDEFLKSLEIETLHIKDVDVLNNIDTVIETIKFELLRK